MHVCVLTPTHDRAQVRKALKPDGAFLGAMLGGDTLYELKEAFALADQERRGGLSAHMSPMAHVADMGQLLHGAGFAMPTGACVRRVRSAHVR